MSMPHRTIRGRILYTSRKRGREGAQRGDERFTITHHADGTRTLRATCEIWDPPPVLRDVTLTLGADYAPRDAFVRLTVDDRFVGSAWFLFGEHEASCEGHTRTEGRFSQRLSLAQRAPAFGAHPIQSDAWLTRLVPDRPTTQPVPRQTRILLPSVDHRGATGPMLATHPGVTIQFVGRESIEVPAGRFEALHYRFIEGSEDETVSRNAPGEHPPYDLWCTADDDRILLRSIATGYMQTQYELASLEIAPAQARPRGPEISRAE
jgi:hypothetical protein